MRGRHFNAADTDTTEPVAVVNEAFVRRFFKSDEDPLDRRFGLNLPENVNTFRIVGIVRDAKFAGFALNQPARPMFFVPLAQTVKYANPMMQRLEFQSHFVRGLLLVTDMAPGALEPQLKRALAEADPNLTVTTVRTLQQQVDRSFDQQRAVASLAGLFGIVALVLAGIGLYGVTAYTVAQRTNEIGIRMALGADRGNVVGLVLHGAFRRIAAGLVLGLPLAVGAGYVLSAQLYGVQFWDPLALAIGAGSLAMCALVATIIPARRAASISPIRGAPYGLTRCNLQLAPCSLFNVTSELPLPSDSDPTHLAAPLAFDRYRTIREIGSGGMATVYLAEDAKHNRLVAIKVMKPAVVQAIGQDRFLREIEIAARLNHPNVVPLFDSGAAGEYLFYVMPYMEGESLRTRLTREGPLPLEEALRLSHQVASALSHAHHHQLVHRDVKPENILMAEGIALVADFGIARSTIARDDDRTQASTVSGGILGTPAYMSPEQACGEPVGPPSDIYSLACVVFEMLAGQPPFEATSSESLIRLHVSATPRAIDTLAPRCPRPSRASSSARWRSARRTGTHRPCSLRKRWRRPLPAASRRRQHRPGNRCPATTCLASGRISSAANASSPNARACSATRAS